MGRISLFKARRPRKEEKGKTATKGGKVVVSSSQILQERPWGFGSFPNSQPHDEDGPREQGGGGGVSDGAEMA